MCLIRSSVYRHVTGDAIYNTSSIYSVKMAPKGYKNIYFEANLTVKVGHCVG